MALDPKTIQRSDFSTARRGYEPSEVDAHLREVAAAVDELQERVEELSSRPESLSEAAHERLGRILEAAEASAAEVRTEAGEEARELIEEAQREARALTEEAERRARQRDTESESTSAERLSRVDLRTTELLRRADSLEEEFDGLLERMRAAAGTAVETLRGDVEELRDELDEMPGEGPPASMVVSSGAEREEHAGREPEPPDEREQSTAVVEPAQDDEPLGDEVIPEPRGGEPLPEPSEEAPPRRPSRPKARRPEESEPSPGRAARAEPVEEPPTEAADPDPAPEPRSGGDSDTEGARLIALNMALSGSSRAETADYLRETFGLEDRALLDDVFDRVQAS